MNVKNIPSRIKNLKNFYIFSIFFLISVFITNIQGSSSLYIFLFLAVILIQILVFYRNIAKNIVIIFISTTLWFLLSIYNFQKINSNISTIKSLKYEKNLIIWEVKKLEKTQENFKKYVFKINYINSKNYNNRNIKIFLNTLPDINYKKWDILEFSWNIEEIKNFSDFEYDKYLYSKSIYWQAFVYKANIKWNNLNKLDNFVDNFRQNILNTIFKIYTNNEASLLSWILIWERWNFNKELSENFNKTWLTHIIAVSWYNITILIIFLSILTKLMSSKLNIILTITSIIFFTLIVWENIPATRAAIMWIIIYLSEKWYKKINFYSLFLSTIIAFVIFNPIIINYDISFHLSFLSLLWIIVFSRNIKEVLFFIPNKFWIKEIISTTICALILTLPIIIINFKQFSIISILTNLLVIPVVPIITLIWFFSLILFNFWNIWWIVIWFFSWFFLKYIIFIATIFGSLKYSVLQIDFWLYKNYFVLIYYLIIILILIRTIDLKPSEEIIKS